LFTSNITFVYQGLHKEKDLRLFPQCSLISNTESRSLSPCSVFCFCLDKKLVSGNCCLACASQQRLLRLNVLVFDACISQGILFRLTKSASRAVGGRIVAP